MKKKFFGYTLVEIMLAIVIFTIGIISLMSLLPVALRSTRRARIMTQAAFLCQAKTEEVLAIPGVIIPEDFDKTGRFTPDFPDFTYVVRKYIYIYEVDGRRVESHSVSEIHVSVFHPINNRKKPLCEYFTLRGRIGEN